MKKKIKDWWWDYIQYPLKSSKQSIKNMIYYFPIVWKDRDWDYTFIYEILKSKLKKHAQYTYSNNQFVNSEAHADKMWLCCKLIDIQQNQFYSEEYFDYYDSSIEWLDVEGNDKLKEFNSNINWENFDEYFKKYPKPYKMAVEGKLDKFHREGIESKEDKLSIAMEIGEYNQNRSKKILHDLLHDNIDMWWE